MPSIYLAPSDYAAYGVPAATVAQVQQASAYIDGWLKRREGLVWSPDAGGNPCYMAALDPTRAWKLQASITPGAAVTIAMPPGTIPSMDLLGEVVVLDRANSSTVEAVPITAIDTTAKTVILGSVSFAHAAQATVEFGLQIREERSLPAKRSMIRLASPNAVRLVSGVGRYGYGRRSDQIQGMYNEINLLATLQTFGGPPQWIAFDATQASISSDTSELWVPAGILLAYYTDVRVWYLAGFPVDGLPSLVKQATADLVGLIASMPKGLLTGAVSRLRAGDTEIDRAVGDLLGSAQYSMLSAYRANLFG